MKNILQQLGEFLGSKFALIESIFVKEIDFNKHVNDGDKHISIDQVNDIVSIHNKNGDAHSDMRSDLGNHVGSKNIHKTSEETLSEITDNHIPESIARKTDVENKISDHNLDPLSHNDIRQLLKNTSVDITDINVKIDKHIKGVYYNPDNAIFTFTFEDGTTEEIDTPLENTVTDGRYDESTDELVLILVSGQEIRIPAANLNKLYSGGKTSTINTKVNSEGKITADLNLGSIGNSYLSTELLQIINNAIQPTGDTKDNIITFTESVDRVNIKSGESHANIFGKIKKWFSDLGNLAFRNTLDPLTLIYENKESVIYNGIDTQTAFIPGTGIRILPKEVNIHGFWEATKSNRFSMKPLILGIQINEDITVYLEKVYINYNTGNWEVQSTRNLDPPLFELFINGILESDKGYYRWNVEYENPVTLRSESIYSEIVYLHVISVGKKDIVPVDPLSFAEGYELYKDSGGISFSFDAIFKVYNFTESSVLKLYKFTNSEWTEMIDNVPTLYKGYIYAYGEMTGKYKITVSEGSEEVSKEFNVIEPLQGVYVVSEYPENLNRYPDGTIFIKE